MAETATPPPPDAGNRHVHWFGNGTSALYAALRGVGCRNGWVAVAPTVCPHVIAAIYASSNRPHFVDIERIRLGMNPAGLAKVVSQVDAVVAVHAFGIPCLIDELVTIAQAAGVPLIEDCAQAEGAAYRGKTVGEFGDVAIFSYGAGKIIEAGGGGRSQTGNPELAGAIGKLHAGMTAPTDAASAASQALSQAFKNIYNNHYPDKLASERAHFHRELVELFPSMLCRDDDSTRVRCSTALLRLENNLATRHRNWRTYHFLLGPLSEPALPFPEGAVPWRYNLMLPAARRNATLKALLAEKLRISSWYPNIAAFLPQTEIRVADADNSEWLGSGIFNLAIDEKTTAAEINHNSERLLSLHAA